MGMSVKKQGGLILIKQPVEGLKAGVAQIVAVHHPFSRRMSQQDIKAPLAHNPGQQPPHPPGHLPFCILVDPVVIAHTAPQPQNPQALILVQVPVNTDTAQRRLLLIAVVVVAPDIEHGTVGKGGQEGEVAGLHIPAGENQVNSLQLVRGVVVPEIPGLAVRYYQNFHGSVFPSRPWIP